MEDLLRKQSQLTADIQKELDSFKKDNTERRYATAKRRLERLNVFIEDFQANHEILVQCEDQTSDYFLNKHYESVRKLYSSAVTTIEKYLQKGNFEQEVFQDVPKTPSKQKPTVSTVPPTSVSVYNNMEEKLRRQAANYKALQRTIDIINIETITEKWELEDTLRTLEARWSKVDSLHWDIESELNGIEDREMEDLFNKYEEEYNKLKKAINSKIWSETHREKTTPKMEIPTFHGNYNQWVSFKDLFTETVHNNTALSKAQKMQFLKSKIRGEAERLIQHLQISSDNYSVCWDILNQRYNNKKLIFSSHINNLLDLPNMKTQSLVCIKRMHDVTMESLNSIRNLGVDIRTWDPLIVHILDLKLDSDSHSEYIDSLKDRRELPTLKDFLNFLEGKFTAMESSRRNIHQKTNSNNQNSLQMQPSTSYGRFYKSNNYKNMTKEVKPIARSAFNVTAIKCPLCHNEHGLYNCKHFLELTNDQKLKTVRDLKVCINCLFSHHGNECISTKTCRKCTKKHNTIMHDACAKRVTSAASVTAAQPNNDDSNTSLHSRVSQNIKQNKSSEVLLATAMVNVKAADGTSMKMRALVDQGSQISLITESAAQRLKIKRKNCKGFIFGVGERESNGKGMINIECQSVYNDFNFQTDVIIMKNLVGKLPNKTFMKPNWTFIENISLADPEFYISRPIDILFGADIYSNILLGGMIKGENSTQPIVQQTHLGWLICGSVNTYKCNVLLHNLDEIKRFWEVEEISEQSHLSCEDQKCIDFYNSTTNRKEDGRYEVRLPLMEDIENKLGSSKLSALAQFRNLEKKFHKDVKLANDYRAFMSEYLALKHMKPANSNETPEYYLPHHGVEKADSLTTQYRVVYNASHKTSSGYSLNDLMHTGPNLQVDLQMLLLKWRQYQYVFMADIEKMFRMILINEDDQKYQKIFWRQGPEEPIQTFFLTTVTYGTRAAPFLAMMTLRRLAAEERARFPEAAEIVESAFFMDDLLYGTSFIEEGKKLISDLKVLLKSGGFNLRKWSSNEPQLLENIKQQENITETEQREVYNFKTENISKPLGLCWDSKNDTFLFQHKIRKEALPLTKRRLLSEISRLFDPLGFLAPLSTKLKLLFQELWKGDLKWDDKVSPEIEKEWAMIKTEINIINQYEIPRWILCHKDDVIQLHGFCDASLEAYACVIYARIEGKQAMLVAAKTKLAPLKKPITVPRLELCGANLLSKLMKKVTEAFSQHELNIYGWTDSTAVLGWLQGEPTRWKPFVANRVQKTTEVMPSACWRYVKSSENPADAASRGLYALQLKEHKLWWQGPSWLSTFNKEQLQTETYTTNQDLRSKHVHVTQKQEDHTINNLLQNYSSFNKIIRIVAWLLRTLAPKPRGQRPSYITLHELAAAKMLIVKYVQHNEFKTDIEHLRKSGTVTAKSKLLNLNPFIDEAGLLRVGGRLAKLQLNMEAKHPKIIPRNSRLAELLIDEAHKLTFHGGPKLTSANLRQQYWIVGGLNAVKKQLRNCVTCRKNKPKLSHQLMGDLPPARTELAPPFFHTGVDYTGFIEVKANKTRSARSSKGYIAVFICMVTKAVHLEIVSDLSSTAFLAALRRMSARRGAPCHLYSDCGTNFVGANRALQEEYEKLRQIFDNNFLNVLANMNIEWHFNIPSWPSAGGLWERAVQSLKFHLRRVVGEQRLTFEEYSTILAQLEACLNSRPLCALTENIEDLEYLSPAHFLVGRAGLTIIQTTEDARTRWHLTTEIFRQIWKKWRSEYLLELTVRNKWFRPQRNIEIGDLVTIHDDNLPAGKWPMARVVELHPGSDGHVRVVTLKTEKGYLKRPIVKLSILPIQKASGDSDSSEQLQENKTRNRRSIGHSSLHSIVMAVLFFTTLVSSVNGISNITHLNEKQTLYFNPLAKLQLLRDQWTLVTYYEMKPFWDGTEAFKKLLDYLEKSCISMDTNNKCNLIVPLLRHEYTELQYYNQLLLTQHFTEHSRRRRRGLINGVGYLANTLFGVLDERFAEQYTRDINLIKHDQAHLKKLWINQTSVVESEYNYLKRLEGIMDKQHKAINRQLNSLDEAIKTLQREVIEVDKEEDFTMSAIMATNMIHKLKEIQAMMVETITDIYQGQFNLHLLTPQQLQEQLNIIAGLLTNDLTLPVENIHTDYRKLYKLMKIRARMTKDYFIFEIKIPLISRESFNLYNVISIPKKVGNYVLTISPVAEIIAINLQKDSYLPITQENLKECVSCDAKTFMCKLQTPIFKMKSDKDLCILDSTNNECKTSKTACENKWTGLTTMNTYLYFCCEQCQLRIICGDRVTAHHLIGSNVIYQDDECIIKTNDFTIYGHRHFESKMNLNYDIQMPNIAPINQIINISLDHYLDENDTVAELTVFKKDIEEKIKSLKQSNVNDGQSVSLHDIHHYALIYCIVGVILLVGVVAAWRKVRRNWNNPNVDPTTEEQRDSRPHPAPRTSISTSQQDIQMVDMDISGKRDVKSRVAFPKLVFSDESL